MVPRQPSATKIDGLIATHRQSMTILKKIADACTKEATSWQSNIQALHKAKQEEQKAVEKAKEKELKLREKEAEREKSRKEKAEQKLRKEAEAAEAQSTVAASTQAQLQVRNVGELLGLMNSPTRTHKF